ncbi:hypothetical protein ABZ619_24655 [Streptomyces sp. NPDC007851]|uniref:hypothetical protein n=1 Tax=Streptomyces sp. NPDC007851 TaxID=3155008 RepID=UPI0033F57A56
MNSTLARRIRVSVVLGGLALIALCGTAAAGHTAAHAQQTAVVRADGSGGASADTTDPWS